MCLNKNFASCTINNCKKCTQAGKKFYLPFEEATLLQEALESEVIPNPLERSFEHLLRVQQLCYKHLPEYLHRALLGIKLGIENPAYIIIKGMPIDEDIPDTPTDGSWQAEKVTYISEGVLLALAMMLGIPFGFTNEKDGQFINQICVVKGKEKEQSSASATVDLGYHAEIAYHHTLRPRFLILYCLRADHERKAATTLVDMRQVIKNLPKWVVNELRKAQFHFKVPNSFSNSSEWAAAKPILSGHIDNPEIIYDFKACKVYGGADAGVKALETLEAELSKPEYTINIYLEPGDALIIPNYYVLHGRSYYEPRHDGKDRWVIRTYVTDSIFPSRANMNKERLLVFDK
jgi:L-asparagine oxygenase